MVSMFKSDDMCKLRIFCNKDHLKEIIDALHKAKAIDIVEHSKSEEVDIGSPMPESGKISDAAIKARSIIHTLEMQDDKAHLGSKKTGKSLEDVDKVADEIVRLYEDVTDKNNRLKEIESLLANLNDEKELIESIESLGLPLDYYNETKNLKYLVGHVDNASSFKQDLKQEIEGNYEVYSNKEEGNLISVFYNKEKEWELLKVLKNHNFQELKIPDEIKGNKDRARAIDEELQKLQKEKSKLSKQLDDIKEKKKNKILESEKFLSTNVVKSEAPLMFGETKNISIISGWVPLAEKDKLKKELMRITDEKIHIIEEMPNSKDPAPVKLNNPESARPYEFFLRIFSMPSYRELDPTIFMFITFPLFFGLMLGDIGYAITVFIIFTILKKYMPQGRDLFRIIIYCSISSFIFGLIYGEFFGFSLSYIDAVADWMAAMGIDFFHRIPENPKSIQNLMVVAIVAGLAHINFGFLVGFINVYKKHGFLLAVLEKFSWVVFQIGIALLIVSYLGLLPLTILPGLILIVVAVVMLAIGEGVQGVVELPSLFVHTGSYLRIMAIGMAKKGLAIIINEQTLLNPAFQGSILAVFAGIILFLVGHSINLALGVFGPFIHSLRLHYVENFTKFYEGGGKEFKAFGSEQ